jgi:hypothetical protein
MLTEEVRCPICKGFSKITRADLIHVLSDKDLAAKVENYIAELSRGAAICDEPLAVVASVQNSDFETQVHTWNPANPMWRRSNKE